ncbi:MAG: FAD-dependent oxidoreductase [Deltaproteobacteria bacterium]|nr:FAD-dependent oxidoreductase [Deltaproteobacteria bacterium]
MTLTAATSYRVVIDRIERLSPTAKAFSFVVPDVPRFEFEAGQWVSLLLPIDAPDRKRAYSIASAPRGDNRFELAVTLIPGGPGSTFMFNLKPSDELQMVGPYGFFTARDVGTRPQVFVATGTGVTPCRSIIQKLAGAQFPAPTTLIFGARTEENILYRAEWEDLARANPSFTFIPTLSKPGDAWRGKTGYVQERVREHLAAARDAVVYICGLKKMVNDVKTILRDELGFAREQVVTEKYD